MYNFLRPESTYPRWGRYFPTVPALPVNDTGTPFRFAWATASQNAMDELVNNFEYLSVDETIKTAANLSWSLEGAVLIGEELYKILDLQITRISGAASAMLSNERTETVIRLKRISNPIGMR